jgi:hypothetical protein
LNLTWKEALQNIKFVSWLIMGVACLVVLGSFAPYFFQTIIQARNGYALHDFILDWFTPTDWSFPIMALLYSAVVITFISNSGNPRYFVILLYTYCAVSWLRILCIYIVPLDPPQGVIPLTDPILSTIVYNRLDFVKDLFFSGHISAMSVMVFAEPRWRLKWIFGAMTVAMSIFILSQHVHYAIDIVFAPPVTYLVYRLVNRFFLKMLPPD